MCYVCEWLLTNIKHIKSIISQLTAIQHSSKNKSAKRLQFKYQHTTGNTY